MSNSFESILTKLDQTIQTKSNGMISLQKESFISQRNGMKFAWMISSVLVYFVSAAILHSFLPIKTAAVISLISSFIFYNYLKHQWEKNTLQQIIKEIFE